MARAQATDALHNFRFHVRAGPVAGLGTDPFQPGGAASPGIGDTSEAGFQAVTTPEYTVEAAEYREGIKTYTEKYPGIPTTNELTMSRGVARNDTAFFAWVLAAIEGREYRSDLDIMHGTREARSSPFNRDADFARANTKRYVVLEAWPMRIKPATDFDATSSDVSLAEVDVAFERFGIIRPDGAIVGI